MSDTSTLEAKALLSRVRTRALYVVSAAILIGLYAFLIHPRHPAEVLSPAQLEHINRNLNDIHRGRPVEGAIIEFRDGTYGVVSNVEVGTRESTMMVMFPTMSTPRGRAAYFLVQTSNDSWMLDIVKITRASDTDYSDAREKFLPPLKKSPNTR